jgi:hypothetical protein
MYLEDALPPGFVDAELPTAAGRYLYQDGDCGGGSGGFATVTK